MMQARTGPPWARQLRASVWQTGRKGDIAQVAGQFEFRSGLTRSREGAASGMLGAKHGGHMSARGIPGDATIASIVSKLGDRDQYVSHVYHNAKKALKAHGAPVLVRIGVTGTGDMPHYRVEAPGFITTHRGDNHSFLFPPNDRLDEGNWSSSAMPLAEVELLLKTIRNKV
jgi:hypothetical protein